MRIVCLCLSRETFKKGRKEESRNGKKGLLRVNQEGEKDLKKDEME